MHIYKYIQLFTATVVPWPTASTSATRLCVTSLPPWSYLYYVVVTSLNVSFSHFLHSSVSMDQFYFLKGPATLQPAPPHSWRRWSHASWSSSRTRPTGGSWPPLKPCPVSARRRPRGKRSSMVRKER